MENKEMANTITSLQYKIMLEEKVSVVYAAILAENALNRFDPRVREGALLWAKDQLTGEFAVGDVTLADVQDELDLTPFQALCVLDIYLKNPGFIPKAEWYLKGGWNA